MSLSSICELRKNDGVFDNSFKKASIGVLSGDCKGNVMAGSIKMVKADCALLTEALALKEGTILAKKEGFVKIIFETDAKIVADDTLNPVREQH